MQKVRFFVVGGSGAYSQDLSPLGKGIGVEEVNTPFGKAGPVHILDLEGVRIGFLSRHGEKGYSITAPFVNYRANIWAAKELGTERVLSWTGPGAINPKYRPGDYVIPDDLLDFTKSRPFTFFENTGLGFIRQNPVFCPSLRKGLILEAKKASSRVHIGGTYACTEGPRLETPAEVRFLKKAGADIVGMTLVPEVFLSRELEMCYASICYITNYAEGVKVLPYRKGELFEGTLPQREKARVDRALTRIPSILSRVILDLACIRKPCPCPEAMLRYKIRGDIGEDWRKWRR